MRAVDVFKHSNYYNKAGGMARMGSGRLEKMREADDALERAVLSLGYANRLIRDCQLDGMEEVGQRAHGLTVRLRDELGAEIHNEWKSNR